MVPEPSSGDDLARVLFERAVAAEQAVHRVRPQDDVPALRSQVRALAREAGVRIRTGVVDGALVVVRADAAVWHETAARMRVLLTPAQEPPPDGDPGPLPSR